MKVLKFGGSSVGTPERIQDVLSIIESAAKTDAVAVVVSAFQKVTDQLIALAHAAKTGDVEWQSAFNALQERHLEAIQKLIPAAAQPTVVESVKTTLGELEDTLRGIALIRECSPRSLDFVMSFGERLSAFIIGQALHARGATQAFYLDARDVVRTDAHHGDAKVDFKTTYAQIQNHLAGKKGVPVMTGFIGRTEDGSTTTIGRSGSDYSAAILGAALQVDVIEIWTDVDGVMSADPRRVKDAFVIDRMSYEEAMELSHFGAKVIHPHTMVPAVELGIPILIKNTFNPSAPGTVIGRDKSEHVVVGISSIDHVVLMNVSGSGLIGIPGISERLFGALARREISVVMIAQASSEHSICFAVPEKEEANARSAIEDEFALEIRVGEVAPVEVISDVSILAAVGSNMCGRRGTAGTLFRALGENGINVIAIAQGLSELNITFIVNRRDAEIALNVVHQAFFLSKLKQINLFVLGAGTVGGALLDQLETQSETLKKTMGLEFCVVGLASRKKMVMNEEGIALSGWRDRLEEQGAPMNLESFVSQAKTVRRSHKIVVDCTAGSEVGDFYADFLRAHMPVVTPNKKFNARPYREYAELRAISRETGAGFYYETNVGAGLPVIETMKDLLKTGDRIVKIEGILSGTLSYIFNHWDGVRPFSEVVDEAQAKGYTEPDPREDLSGQDVARKLLILAREMGLAVELEAVEVESLVPEACPVDRWKAALDAALSSRHAEAAAQGLVLRYVGCVEKGQASVALKALPSNHPFASLKGSDNVIAFTTERYNETPLLVQGPGAGPGVTAGGVFADILRAAHQFS